METIVTSWICLQMWRSWALDTKVWPASRLSQIRWRRSFEIILVRPRGFIAI
jgi:hypothetical protein